MIAKRIQLYNYGPIESLDISCPFDGDLPKPLALVGENGLGKSILLSHFVNGMLLAQGIAFPESRELDEGKVYKIRHDFYIGNRSQFYFSRVDFESELYIEEYRSRTAKEDFEEIPEFFSRPEVSHFWQNLKQESKDSFSASMYENEDEVRHILSNRVVLYFPPNRFEEPAWSNVENLASKARYMHLKNLEGFTDRRIFSPAPLRNNQDWLFDLLYDRAVHELGTTSVRIPAAEGGRTFTLPVVTGYSGSATSVYEIALSVMRAIVNRPDARFGIGPRHNRVVSVESSSGQICSNVFQLSTGETSLLNLFLTILRDFDLCGSTFSKAEDVRGVVVVDEIDLHLHAVHQHRILPNLISMFPKVQFIVTTHSPLFILGMQRVFGEDGFVLYELPEGQRISPEEFGEFGSAFQQFTKTGKYTESMRRAIRESQKPVVFVEGKTDVKYIEKAADYLNKQALLSGVELKDGGGSGGLDAIWKNTKSALADLELQPVLLLYDGDEQRSDARQSFVRKSIPLEQNNPLQKGIENLFERATLERALQYNDAFIDIHKTQRKERGTWIQKPEEWSVNRDEKANLCEWICEYGTKEDFQHFQSVFDLLEAFLA